MPLVPGLYEKLVAKCFYFALTKMQTITKASPLHRRFAIPYKYEASKGKRGDSLFYLVLPICFSIIFAVVEKYPSIIPIPQGPVLYEKNASISIQNIREREMTKKDGNMHRRVSPPRLFKP